jgi:hypothetical protein
MKLHRPVFVTVFVAILLSVSASAVLAADYTAADFKEPSYCNGCHMKLYEQWRQSAHAHAVSDELFQKTVAFAVEDLGGPNNPDAQAIQAFCFKCHSPIGFLIGEVPPESAIAVSGVSCDFCHTVSGSNGTGNGSFINTPGNVKRGPFVDAISPAHETTLSIFLTQSEFCGTCHDVFHPTNGLPLEETYTEWKNSPYPAKNVQCQHCMMPVMKNTSIAVDGPTRPVVFGHTFPGGNFADGDAAGARKLLRSAAKVELTTDLKSAKPGEPVFVTVKVTNTGAGHKLPTGLAEVRNLWLEINAIDLKGNTTSLYEERYVTVLEDAEGKHDGTVPVWRAVKIFSDNRIAPDETRTYEKSFKIPAGAQGHYKVAATLNYSAADIAFTKEMKAKAKPSMVIASAEKTVQLPGGDTVEETTAEDIPGWLVWGGIAVVLILVFIGSVVLMRTSRSDA